MGTSGMVTALVRPVSGLGVHRSELKRKLNIGEAVWRMMISIQGWKETLVKELSNNDQEQLKSGKLIRLVSLAICPIHTPQPVGLGMKQLQDSQDPVIENYFPDPKQ
ncbi:hypothetical protein WISP_15303 [Willisornis vidua]|uniref:Uncharacterized protein n=1 Tax=Willisornis vidua TaxID=1566151 RepID=A0ABQ9DQL9_9PASS|nr:hypothetical protein WISP_15303 [Willisornis vidua]